MAKRKLPPAFLANIKKAKAGKGVAKKKSAPKKTTAKRKTTRKKK